jgi:hypothetical protein
MFAWKEIIGYATHRMISGQNRFSLRCGNRGCIFASGADPNKLCETVSIGDCQKVATDVGKKVVSQDNRNIKYFTNLFWRQFLRLMRLQLKR